VRERAGALVSRYGLGAVDAEILGRDPGLVHFFEATAAGLASATSAAKSASRGRGSSSALSEGDPALREAGPAAANWIINSLPPLQAGRALEELPFGPEELATLIGLVQEGAISSTGAHDVLEVLAREGGDPRALVERLDLAQVSDAGAIRPVAEKVVAANPEKVREYREGKTGLLGFFMGQVMRGMGGKADPELARSLLKELLD
jgi:glutaminyl-tRNA synthetase